MTTRYQLGFTSGALLLREAAVASARYVDLRDWTHVRTALVSGNLLQARTPASSRRLSREVVQRLAVLSDREVEVLADAVATERAHLLWLAACRRYEVIGEFAEEVVRERFLLLTPTLDDGDFDSFVRGKALWHPELLALKDSTRRKLRANLFRMLREAGLLSAGVQILPAMPSPKVAAILAREPSEARYFPIAAVTAGSGVR